MLPMVFAFFVFEMFFRTISPHVPLTTDVAFLFHRESRVEVPFQSFFLLLLQSAFR